MLYIALFSGNKPSKLEVILLSRISPRPHKQKVGALCISSYNFLANYRMENQDTIDLLNSMAHGLCNSSILIQFPKFRNINIYILIYLLFLFLLFHYYYYCFGEKCHFGAYILELQSIQFLYFCSSQFGRSLSLTHYKKCLRG